MEQHKYNTQNSKLVLPEYGRNVQIMVDHLLTIEDREERNKAARTVIDVMGNLIPQYRDSAEYRHKLWDHLIIMSDFKLDIDCPYPMPDSNELVKSPDKLQYPRKFIKFRHYGLIAEKLIEEVHKQPTPELKKQLALLVALHMKKSYLIWNKDVVSDKQIFKDINTIYGMELLDAEVDTIGSTSIAYQRRNKVANNRNRNGQNNKNQRNKNQRNNNNNNNKNNFANKGTTK